MWICIWIYIHKYSYKPCILTLTEKIRNQTRVLTRNNYKFTRNSSTYLAYKAHIKSYTHIFILSRSISNIRTKLKIANFEVLEDIYSNHPILFGSSPLWSHSHVCIFTTMCMMWKSMLRQLCNFLMYSIVYSGKILSIQYTYNTYTTYSWKSPISKFLKTSTQIIPSSLVQVLWDPTHVSTICMMWKSILRQICNLLIYSMVYNCKILSIQYICHIF